MTDFYKPGSVLLLPSSRTLRVQHVRGTTYHCIYECPRPGERSGLMVNMPDVTFTRRFLARYAKVVAA